MPVIKHANFLLTTLPVNMDCSNRLRYRCLYSPAARLEWNNLMNSDIQCFTLLGNNLTTSCDSGYTSEFTLGPLSTLLQIWNVYCAHQIKTLPANALIMINVDLEVETPAEQLWPGLLPDLPSQCRPGLGKERGPAGHLIINAWKGRFSGICFDGPASDQSCSSSK